MCLLLFLPAMCNDFFILYYYFFGLMCIKLCEPDDSEIRYEIRNYYYYPLWYYIICILSVYEYMHIYIVIPFWHFISYNIESYIMLLYILLDDIFPVSPIIIKIFRFYLFIYISLYNNYFFFKYFTIVPLCFIVW